MSASARETVTIEQAAESLAHFIGNQTDRLMSELIKLWPHQQAPGRTNTLDFVVECVLFEAFPVDVIVAKEFGAHSATLREAMLDRLFEAIKNQFVVPEDRGRFSLARSDFENVLGMRFSEYADAWKNRRAGQTWGESVAKAAWKRISACDDTPATLVIRLALDLAATFETIAGISSRFEVVPNRLPVAVRWDTTWLCKDCGEALSLSYRNPETGQIELIFERNRDAGGEFLRCTRCGGKHYYALDHAGIPELRNFEPGPPFYRLKRRLGLAT